jgi:hypothetical protein
MLITDEELTENEKYPLIIETMLSPSRIAQYRFDAPYQRGQDIWNLKMKQNLIKSILAGIPVGSVHLVSLSESDEWNLLDGKSRIEAISGFFKGQFVVDWLGKSYAYKDLPSDLRKRFLNYTLEIVEWRNIHLLKQRDVFEKVNAQSNLNQHERLYCKYFFCKSLLNYIWENCCKRIKSHTRKEQSDNRRFSGIRWCHDILYLCFGLSLTDIFSIRQHTTKKIQESTRAIDSKILKALENTEIKDSDRDFITDELLKNIGVDENVKMFKKICECFADILECQTSAKKRMHKNDCMDLISFFISKIQSKTLTIAQIKSNSAAIYSFVCDYINTKSNSPSDFRWHQTNVGVMKLKHELMDKLFNKLQLDNGIKEKKISDNEKSFALLSSDGECEMCSCILTDENRVFDHVDPKSKYSSTTVGTICKTCNQTKSNVSGIDLHNMLEYLKKQKEKEENITNKQVVLEVDNLQIAI